MGIKSLLAVLLLAAPCCAWDAWPVAKTPVRWDAWPVVQPQPVVRKQPPQPVIIHRRVVPYTPRPTYQYQPYQTIPST